MISHELQLFFFNRSFLLAYSIQVFLTEELYYNRIVSPSATQQTIHFTPFLHFLDFMMPNVLARGVFAVVQIGEGSQN